MIPRLCEEILKSRNEWILTSKPQTSSKSPRHKLTNMLSKIGVKRSRSQPHLYSTGGAPVSESETTGHSEDEDMYVCPVMCYSSFQERVRNIDPYVSTDFIQIAANYLQDMGEVSCIFRVTRKFAIYHVVQHGDRRMQ